METQPNNSAISINLSEGCFSISGSEDFINKHIAELKDFLINNKAKELPQEKVCSIADTKLLPALTVGHEQKLEDKYASLYHIDKEDNTVSILKKVPGGNKADKTKNIALIVLHAKGDKILGSELKESCEKQSCYDQSNFAAIFNRDIENFIKKGSGKSWTLELTFNGKEAARQLLEEMLNANK